MTYTLEQIKEMLDGIKTSQARDFEQHGWDKVRSTFLASAPDIVRRLVEEVERLQEQNTKYEKVVEAAKEWTEFWTHGDMPIDEFPLMSELQDALKELEEKV